MSAFPGVAQLKISPAGYPNGFCKGSMNVLPTDPDVFWKYLCKDKEDPAVIHTRMCIDSVNNVDGTCPPATPYYSIAYDQNQYSVFDYAMDKVDESALLKSSNTKELLGNNIAIYSIYLAGSAFDERGEYLMRYMADVGDDGDRSTAPCLNGDGPGDAEDIKTNCGQYYYAPTGDRLLPIFEDIASRIYTRITQ